MSDTATVVDHSIWGIAASAATAGALKLFKMYESRQQKKDDEPTVIRKELREEVNALRSEMKSLREELRESKEMYEARTKEYLALMVTASELQINLTNATAECSRLTARVGQLTIAVQAAEGHGHV